MPQSPPRETRWYNETAEQRLIFRIFCGREKHLLDEVEPEDFYVPANQRIIRAGKAILRKDQQPDLVTLVEETDAQTIATVTSYRRSTADEDYDTDPAGYIPILRKYRARRDAYKALTAAMSDLQADDHDPDEVMASLLSTLSGAETNDQPRDLQQVLLATYDVIAARARGEIAPVSTGIPAMDELLGGLYPGEMTVIGARPGTGKTALSLQIAEHAARNGKRAVFVSREMSDVQIGERILARHGVSMARSRMGRLRQDDWTAAGNAVATEDYKRILVDNRSVTVTGIRTACKRWKARGGLDLVCVDYLQLIHPEGGRFGSRNDQVAALSWALKELSIELQVPVLVLSQLNRELRSRSDGEPQLTDLRDSGAVEQDADNVWLLYCPQKVSDPDVQALIDVDAGTNHAVVAIKIAKARQSVPGTVYTHFIKDKMRFEDTRPQPLPQQMTMEVSP